MRGRLIFLGMALAIGSLDLLNIFTTDGSKTGPQDVRLPAIWILKSSSQMMDY